MSGPSHDHPTDKAATTLVGKIEKAHKKLFEKTGHGGAEEEPAGGFSDTPIPKAPPGFTIRITFHSAENLPSSDFPTMSSDPFIHATLKTDLPKRHKQDNDLILRTPTIHRNTDPKWETQWVVAHIPASGFFLKCRLYDEDQNDYDDRLGNAHVQVGHIDQSWEGFVERKFPLKKRMGSKRAYTIRGARALLSRSTKMGGSVTISVENLGPSPGDNGGKPYTVAPLPWSRHYSPLIGRLANTKDRETSKDGKKVQKYNFQAVQMQLRGPVPEALYHRYVEFKPFVAGMFTDRSLRGRILHRALHHQHARIYSFDSSTLYGVFEKPCLEMTRQFLEFVNYDQGGRIFTYVVLPDGLFRFTETGKEFGIDLLSKHTMHSDVSIYIACSGEFFVRRRKKQHLAGDDQQSTAGDSDKHDHSRLSQDPADYQLYIDNDSGTYRPNAKLLPLLQKYMADNLPGLHVKTLDCQQDKDKMKQFKDEQNERKKQSGNQVMYMQNSSMSSLSSSDEEELDARANDEKPRHGYQRGIDRIKDSHSHQHDNGAATPDHMDTTRSEGRYSNRRRVYRRRNDERRHEPADSGRDYLEAEEPDADDRDARDRKSRSSSDAEADRDPRMGDRGAPTARGANDDSPRRDGGYPTEALPYLLKHNVHEGGRGRPDDYGDRGGSAATPESHQPAEGDHLPDGGMAYHRTVHTV